MTPEKPPIFRMTEKNLVDRGRKDTLSDRVQRVKVGPSAPGPPC